MEQSMKWYKFVIYVQLFLSAIMNVANAVMYFSGSHYDGMAQQVYLYFGNGLKMTDLMMGIVSFVLAALAIVVRQKLKNYKTDGPKWYINYLALSIIVSVVYIILVYMITGVMSLDSSIAAQLAVSLVLLFANKKYFDNRKHLFIN
jgi:heme/copper-type cytochrome/quinol oxidase subunit 2